jgi:hypothetical protein
MTDDLDAVDQALLANHSCCDCGHMLIEGPCGGAAQNFYCTNRSECRAGFNLTFLGDRLVFSQRIGEVSDERWQMYSKADDAS